MRSTVLAAIFTFLLWGVPQFATGDINDIDADGILDAIDNCSQAANPAQDDTDGDDCGNLCDADYSQRGRVDYSDFGFFSTHYGTANPLLQHLEPIGVPGRLVGFGDFGFFTANFGKVPGPSGRRPERQPARRSSACGDGHPRPD